MFQINGDIAKEVRVQKKLPAVRKKEKKEMVLTSDSQSLKSILVPCTQILGLFGPPINVNEAKKVKIRTLKYK